MVDFSIERDRDRVQCVQEELAKLTNPSKSQLEMMANYILYGKDENGHNAVDRKEIEIETKYKTYQKKKIESLDELIETPTFNENDVKPLKRTVYKNPKPQLDKSIEELQPYLEAIQEQENLQKKLERMPQTPQIKTQLWKLKHYIIQLKKEQYLIQDIVRPQYKSLNTTIDLTDLDFLDGEILPLGLKIGDLKRFTNPKEDQSLLDIDKDKATINLEDPNHIYALLENWEILYEKSLSDPFHNAKWLLETLDWYIDKAELDESRLEIIKLKKFKIPNTLIKKTLEKKFGSTYSENYISTIYTKEICKKIAEAATLHKDEWNSRNDESKWKKCSCCGRWKLIDKRNFVKKKNSADGFTSRCKSCDKKKRKENKR